MLIRPGIELANLTDIGCARTDNEDYYCYAEPEDEDTFRNLGRLAVIADGMGGHEGGQIASSLAVEAIRDTYFDNPSEEPETALLRAIANAHAAIKEYASWHPELKGMGSTCTAIALSDSRLCYGHVGDSRLYLIRDGSITCLTQDQTIVQKLVAAGVVRPEDARTHPERNVLTSALGMDSPPAAELPETPIAVYPEDILLLCTDGLHGLVDDEELLAVATQNRPSDACRALVEMAKSRGGHDNITLQILRVVSPGAAPENR
jgi:PPM family protein phosphatase